MKRTTIRLDEDLLAATKVRAAEQRTTVTAIIDAALRRALASDSSHPESRVELPTFRGNGLRPGIDLTDNAALRDTMDRDSPVDRMR